MTFSAAIAHGCFRPKAVVRRRRSGAPPDGKNYDETELVEGKGGAFTRRTTEVSVQPGETAKTFSRSVEYKHRNDVFTLVFNWPTKTPELEVEVSPSLDYDAGFSHRAGVTSEPMILPRKTLQGTFLPNQSVFARWWPKVNPPA